jgi:hypothetical protein
MTKRPKKLLDQARDACPEAKATAHRIDQGDKMISGTPPRMKRQSCHLQICDLPICTFSEE